MFLDGLDDDVEAIRAARARESVAAEQAKREAHAAAEALDAQARPLLLAVVDELEQRGIRPRDITTRTRVLHLWELTATIDDHSATVLLTTRGELPVLGHRWTTVNKNKLGTVREDHAALLPYKWPMLQLADGRPAISLTKRFADTHSTLLVSLEAFLRAAVVHQVLNAPKTRRPKSR